MKYLAFDIEAANGYKPYSICSIGIVVADEKFHILQRTNVWINPHTSYNLNGTRKNVGIDLHLDKALLEASPAFNQVYSKIRALLTNPECVVVGHAVDADVRMLNAACKRYNLPSIDFNFICSQLLFKMYRGESEVRALSKIAAELGVTYQEHNSEEDAWMSLKTLEYLVADSGLTVAELLEKYHVRVGSNVNFEIVRPVSLDGQVSKKHVTQLAIEKIKNYLQKVRPESKRYEGKVFCLSRSLELSDSELLWQVLTKIAKNGGRYSSKLLKCNVYVGWDEQTAQDVMREKRIDELVQLGQVKIVSAKDFLAD